MALNIVRDLFSLQSNQPLKLADDHYIRILRNKIFKKTYDILD